MRKRLFLVLLLSACAPRGPELNPMGVAQILRTHEENFATVSNSSNILEERISAVEKRLGMTKQLKKDAPK